MSLNTQIPPLTLVRSSSTSMEIPEQSALSSKSLQRANSSMGAIPQHNNTSSPTVVEVISLSIITNNSPPSLSLSSSSTSLSSNINGGGGSHSDNVIVVMTNNNAQSENHLPESEMMDTIIVHHSKEGARLENTTISSYCNNPKKLQHHTDMSFSTLSRNANSAPMQLIDEIIVAHDDNGSSELKCEGAAGSMMMHTSKLNSGTFSNGGSEVKLEDDLLMQLELKEISSQQGEKKDVILSPTCEEHEHHHKDDSSEHSNKRYSREFLMGFIPRWTFHPSKQSEARDLLALERTQLAWIRTALSVVAIGIAVSKCKLYSRNAFSSTF